MPRQQGECAINRERRQSSGREKISDSKKMDLEQKAIERIRMASEMSLRMYQKPLIITDSGGKDSLICRELARWAGIPYEVLHNHTTADAPETVYYVRRTFRRLEETGISCTVNLPFYKGKRVTMWTLIPMKKFPPTRMQRYCCQILKENSCRNRFVTTGVRWAESLKRKDRGIFENYTRNADKKVILNNDNDERRRLFESCELKGKRMCNPIVDWTDEDVWDFIRSERLEVNPLYDRGFFRVGCLGCSLAGKRRWREFRLYPAYERAYRRAFEKMMDVIHAEGIPTKWKDASDAFSWWMEENQTEGQISLSDLEEWNMHNGGHGF